MYGRRLYDQYKVPIGLIATYWGGTCAEAWSSHDVLKSCGLVNNTTETKKLKESEILIGSRAQIQEEQILVSSSDVNQPLNKRQQQNKLR